jgi:drug/metabolite transporter (DMT)-like permease
VKIRSLIYLGIFAAMSALGHILQKMVLNLGVNQLVLAFLRITLGFIAISLLLLAKKHHPVTLVKNNFRHFFILGVCFSGIGILVKLWGLSLTTATNAAFIMSLSSLSQVIFAYFFLGENAPKRFYVVLIMMIAGVYLVTTGGKQLLPRIGDIIILALSVLIGSMEVYGKKVLETLSVIQTAFGRSLVGMIFLGLLVPVFAPHGFSTIPNFPVLLLVLANGITFSSSLIFFYKALQIERASNTGMFALLVPVLTAVLGYLFLAEILNLYQVIGGAIILAGSFMISKLQIKQANL